MKDDMGLFTLLMSLMWGLVIGWFMMWFFN